MVPQHQFSLVVSGFICIFLFFKKQTHLLIKNHKGRAREMARLAKCWPCTHEDQSLIPRTHVKTPGLSMCAWSPSTGVAETVGSFGLYWPVRLAYFMSSRPSERHCVKNQRGQNMEKDT